MHSAKGYDVPEILRYPSSRNGFIGAEPGQARLPSRLRFVANVSLWQAAARREYRSHQAIAYQLATPTSEHVESDLRAPVVVGSKDHAIALGSNADFLHQ